MRGFRACLLLARVLAHGGGSERGTCHLDESLTFRKERTHHTGFRMLRACGARLALGTKLVQGILSFQGLASPPRSQQSTRLWTRTRVRSMAAMSSSSSSGGGGGGRLSALTLEAVADFIKSDDCRNVVLLTGAGGLQI